MTILELEKNLWERVDNVVRCGYGGDMENNFASHCIPNNTTRVARQMFLAGGGKNSAARYAHISSEVAQGTIDTHTIDANHYALTLCGQTWESGEAYADLGNSAFKICQACSKRYLK